MVFPLWLSITPAVGCASRPFLTWNTRPKYDATPTFSITITGDLSGYPDWDVTAVVQG